MEATVLSWHLFGYCSTYPKFCEITYCQYLWKGFSDFIDFLHVVIWILLDILWSYKNMLFWVGSVSHTLSSNRIVRGFKLKNLENYIRHQIHFLLPLKLRKHHAVLGYDPKKLLINQLAEYFTFDSLILVQGAHCYIVLVSRSHQQNNYTKRAIWNYCKTKSWLK